MEPTINDVLSGRGAWFNQHPGNEHFRRMLEDQKAVYMTGTKKQKMNMSKAIVEAIYSMEPPGRFLKQCPDTGQWNELSKREAADKAAQAMAYAIKGESLKQKRRERRRSRLPPSLRPKDGSSSAADGLIAGGGGNNNVQSASEVLLPDNSQIPQQVLQQLLQSSGSTTLPTSSASPIIDQNGLARLLVQTVEQQQQQQLPPQRTFGENSFGLEGLTQLLNQTQQQRNQQQQQQFLLQRLLNQQNLLLPSPSATLQPTLSLSAPFLMGPRSHQANSNPLQNQVHLQSNPSNALLRSVLSNVGISNAPQGAQQLDDQLQRSLLRQQQQLLASSLGASSNDHLTFQQQQLQPLFDPLHQWQAALQHRQNTELAGSPPPIYD